MNIEDFRYIHTRRDFLKQWAGGLGTIALWHLLAGDGLTAGPVEGLPHVNPLEPRPPHFAAKAKNVIFLFMAGGPARQTWDASRMRPRSV